MPEWKSEYWGCVATPWILFDRITDPLAAHCFLRKGEMYMKCSMVPVVYGSVDLIQYLQKTECERSVSWRTAVFLQPAASEHLLLWLESEAGVNALKKSK